MDLLTSATCSARDGSMFENKLFCTRWRSLKCSANELKYVPEPGAKKQTWLYALAHGRPDAKEKVDGQYEWVLRPELVAALQAMKWA
jgi:hypothetical protein